MEFRASVPQDHQQIYSLMEKAFQTKGSSILRDAGLQKWKYWDAHPDWEGARSYVLAQGEHMVAHGAVWPMQLQGFRAERWKGIYLIDWVSNSELAAGGGVVLLRRVARLGDGIFAIGGSEDTRAIMPKIGFHEHNQAGFYARPLKPTGQAITHPRKNWKLPLRWLRNLHWQLGHPIRTAELRSQGWTVEAIPARSLPVEIFPQAVPAGLLESSEDWIIPVRSTALFCYWERSPWARFQFFLLRFQDRPIGYYCLAMAQGQARLADIWVQSGDPGDWHAAYALSLDTAACQPDAMEMVAMASSPLAREALLKVGFRQVEALPILFFGRGEMANPKHRFLLNMADADFAFLHEGRPDYWT